MMSTPQHSDKVEEYLKKRARQEHAHPIRDFVEEVREDEEVIIPGDAERLARETAAISPERRPAEPKIGPRGIRVEIMIGYLIVLITLAVILSVWWNVFAGVVALAIGLLAPLLNPVVGAASQRAIEREAIVQHHHRPDPDAVVLRQQRKGGHAAKES